MLVHNSENWSKLVCQVITFCPPSNDKAPKSGLTSLVRTKFTPDATRIQTRPVLWVADVIVGRGARNRLQLACLITHHWKVYGRLPPLIGFGLYYVLPMEEMKGIFK